MTSKQSPMAGSDHPNVDVDGARSNGQLDARPDDSFGWQLRHAREARGLDLDGCASTLRLPTRVLRQLEQDEYGAIDYQVYLASYINKYARFLSIDEDVIDAQLNRIKSKSAEPALVATGGISHSRYLLERYATAATYVVLTAVIVVPMVWLGIRGTLDRDMAHLAPLDAAPVAQQDAAGSAASPASTKDSAAAKSAPLVALAPPAIQVPHADEQPLLASMVPNLSENLLEARAPAAATSAADPATGSGQHSLELFLADASWVEVTDKNGQRLEYGLLPAGSSKTYRSDAGLDVRIGNANGAQVKIDGQAMPLDDYRRANVAHFHVAVDGGKAVPSGV